MTRGIQLLAAIASLFCVASTANPDRSRQLHAVIPQAVTRQDAESGIIALSHAVAYLPRTLKPGEPAPLLVLLHGAGGRGERVMRHFQDRAEQDGLVLLAPDSSDVTWDMIVRRRAGHEDEAGNPDPRSDFGPDIRRIDAAMAEIFARVAIDPHHVALGGFSDGATYALSIGPENARLFDTLIAFSPGYVYPTDTRSLAQRVFIAHGRSDSVLPSSGSRQIARYFRERGGDVVFYPFDGDHRIDEAASDAALKFFLKSARH